MNYQYRCVRACFAVAENAFAAGLPEAVSWRRMQLAATLVGSSAMYLLSLLVARPAARTAPLHERRRIAGAAFLRTQHARLFASRICRYGTTTTVAFKTLLADGGFTRFYR
jgi:Na+-transporting NADH:ubiquinone oxidoreductase subunit NqrB